MSVRISLDNQPEFYTNLDVLSGRVILGLNRPEQVGSIVVKLEGESATALVPNPYQQGPGARQGPPGGHPDARISENHKILYKLQQVFPDEYYASSSNPYGAYPLHPGEHEFPFKFKLPINNACSDPMAMSKIGGLGGVGGFGGGGLFGIGGVRTMDGTKQLFLQHVTRTLPPSLTGYPREAEIRYYIKVTIQRPGFLKENWRYQVGLKFLPIEPPRPPKTSQEVFARRPFTFRPRSPMPEIKKKSSFFSRKPVSTDEPPASENGDAKTTLAEDIAPAPSIEMSARLPHPCILTCNKPVPLRLVAKKLNNNPEQVYLVSFQLDLTAYTELRAGQEREVKCNRWVVANGANLSIPLTAADTEVGKEIVVPDDIWRNLPLPNTVAPSFHTCNISRRYEVELKLGLAWGKPKTGFMASKESYSHPQTIHLPLHFAEVAVFSGITPPAELVQAARTTRPGRATLNIIPPRLPPRSSFGQSPISPSQQQFPPQARPPHQQQVPPQQTHDPLYPPQLAPGQTAPPGQAAPPYDDAPPSYDEAIAENLAGPFDGMQSRPAYSGVTNENAPSQMPPTKN